MDKKKAQPKAPRSMDYTAMRLAIEGIEAKSWPMPAIGLAILLGVSEQKISDARRALKIRYKKADGMLQNEAIKIAAWIAFEGADHAQRAPLIREVVTHRLGAWRG
jgi:hypothetical protein